MGNLTRDPETRHTSSNTAVCNFGLAVNRKFKTKAGENQEEVTFVDCEAWGRVAEVIAQYMSKGKPILVDGRLKLDEWEDKNGGGKRSKLRVVVESFQFVGGKDDAGSGGGGKNRSPSPASTGGHSIDPDSIPF
jgi:single-strand DNA-binding protein